MSIDDLLPLSPALFFDIGVEIPYAKELKLSKCFKGSTLLPNLEDFCDEEHFSKVAAAWNDEGLIFAFEVNVPFTKSDYPAYERSDALEILIDTRGLKSARIFHRFCHHFVILAGENMETSALEVTRFRGEDKHELCDPKLIEVEREFLAKSYKVKVTLPKEILNGYEPKEFKELKFTTRIHRAKGEPDDFSHSSKEYQIMSTPMLWTDLNLVKK
ncbi:MAG: hypothetical protein P0S95_01970 [Rhabdochlamydiaceae bacterium]|nr:hypothetical protein [Candidatus Amphrikana amoebophyrae]